MSFIRISTTTLAAVVLLVVAAGPLFAATVTGTVKYDGKVPTMRQIDMAAEPKCAGKYDSPPRSEMLVLGDGNTISNIFVHVKNAPAGGPSSEKAVLDQDGCRYVPHVLGVMVGQEFKILNNDGIMHNVHALPKVNKQFNMAMPASRTEAVHTFSKEEEAMFKIKCDVHPWMNAFVAVMTHPFFDTTEADGNFSIEGLPAGTYEIEVWHEKLGTKTASVTVTGDETKVVDFTMSPPKR